MGKFSKYSLTIPSLVHYLCGGTFSILKSIKDGPLLYFLYITPNIISCIKIYIGRGAKNSTLFNMCTHLNTSLSYLTQQTLPFKDTISQYSGINTKLSIWCLLVTSKIQGRKYIIRKCGGTRNAVTFFLKKPDDPDLLHRKPWFILYWLGPLADAFIAVLLLVILSSEEDVIKGDINTIVEIFSDFYITLSTSSAAKLFMKWLSELVELCRQSLLLNEIDGTTKNAFILLVIYVFFELGLEIFKSYYC